mmetsp:Transcript_26659/g.52002  ORF Transcript_26659/g.52002 Transcript_26659/m.52002 type:complete len:193 (-) Transcript_26659:60-638(-)
MRATLGLLSICAIQRLGCSAFASAPANALLRSRIHALAPSSALGIERRSRFPAGLRGGSAAALPSMSMSSDASGRSKDPMSVVQRQLEVYNTRDIDAFMTLFSEDCTLVDLQTGNVLATGHAEIRPRYVKRFTESEVHAEVTGRLSNGRVVVDREVITGLPDGGAANVMAVYQVNEAGLINRVQFVWENITK